MSRAPALAASEAPAVGGEGWRYRQGESGRDLRLDLLRGACLLKMVLNHLWRTPLSVIHTWTGFVSAAAGFFFLSGVTVGMVHKRRCEREGLLASSRVLWRRATDLYLANLGLVLLLAGAEAQGWFGGHLLGRIESQGWFALFGIDHGYFLHVLPRYSVFLLATPAALWLLRSGRTTWLIAISGGLWAANLVTGGALEPPGLVATEPVSFRLASWQLLFFAGLVLGFHREAAARLWQRVASPATIGLGALVAAALVWLHLAHLAGRTGIGFEAERLWLDRSLLAPVRVVNAAVVFAVCFWVVDRYWQPLVRAFGWLLLPYGRFALGVFILHIPVTWFGSALLRRTSLSLAGDSWAVLPLVLVAVLGIWALVRWEPLAAVVPR